MGRMRPCRFHVVLAPLFFCLSPAATTASPPADKAAAPERRVLEVGQRPESVTRGFGGKFFITVMNAPGDASDGVVKVIDGDDVKIFAEGFDEPKGICFTGKYLVISDVKRLWQIDSKGGVSVLADDMDFPTPPSYLNDVSCEPGGKAVFVTDMGANTKMKDPAGDLWPLDSKAAKELPAIGRVFRVGMDHKIQEVVAPDAKMPCPNGVAAHSRRHLLVTDFFTGNIFRKKGRKSTLLATGLRGADGVEEDRRGTVYVSSWTQGKLWRLKNARQAGKKTVEPELIAQGFKSAADFYLDKKANQILLPDMKAGTLTFIPLPK